jgi:hypothetical protein
VTYQTPLIRKTEVKTWVGCAWFPLPTCAIKAIPLAKNLQSPAIFRTKADSPQQKKQGL